MRTSALVLFEHGDAQTRRLTGFMRSFAAARLLNVQKFRDLQAKVHQLRQEVADLRVECENINGLQGTVEVLNNIAFTITLQAKQKVERERQAAADLMKALTASKQPARGQAISPLLMSIFGDEKMQPKSPLQIMASQQTAQWREIGQGIGAAKKEAKAQEAVVAAALKQLRVELHPDRAQGAGDLERAKLSGAVIGLAEQRPAYSVEEIQAGIALLEAVSSRAIERWDASKAAATANQMERVYQNLTEEKERLQEHLRCQPSPAELQTGIEQAQKSLERAVTEARKKGIKGFDLVKLFPREAQTLVVEVLGEVVPDALFEPTEKIIHSIFTNFDLKNK